MSESVDFGSMTLEEALTHHGVKGMKWGVRRQGRIDRLDRVASGTASRTDKANVALTEISRSGRKRNNGLAGAAANKASNMRARDARAAAGEATIKDILARHGGDRFVDTGRADTGKVSSRGTTSAGRQGRIDRLERVASGAASRGDKANVALTEVSISGRKKNDGLAGAAANKAANMRARDERAKKGEATLKDLLARHGGDRLVDTGRVDKGRLMTPKSAKLTIKPEHSKTTKRVISDHNNLSNHDFARKYSTSKTTYAKRVKKYGDPYMNSPLAKIGKKLA